MKGSIWRSWLRCLFVLAGHVLQASGRNKKDISDVGLGSVGDVIVVDVVVVIDGGGSGANVLFLGSHSGSVCTG